MLDWLRNLFATRLVIKREYRDLTPAEQDAFDAAFASMDDAFAEMDKVFAAIRKAGK